MPTQLDESNSRKLNDTARTNSPTVWAISAMFLIALLAVLFFYNGSDNHPKSGENPPPSTMVSGSRSK
jgi:hypothetical protein